MAVTKAGGLWRGQGNRPIGPADEWFRQRPKASAMPCSSITRAKPQCAMIYPSSSVVDVQTSTCGGLALHWRQSRNRRIGDGVESERS